VSRGGGAAGSVAAPSAGRRTRSLQRQDARVAYAFVAPAVLVVLVVVAIPIAWNVALSFQDLRLVELQDFNFFSTDVSLDNYRSVTSGDFWDLLVRTFVYAVAGTTVAMLLGLWAALVVRSAFRAGASCAGCCCSRT
jgi:multiple sugar transport system permease protein